MFNESFVVKFVYQSMAVSCLNPFNFPFSSKSFRTKIKLTQWIDASWCCLPLFEIQCRILSVLDGDKYHGNLLIYQKVMFQTY